MLGETGDKAVGNIGRIRDVGDIPCMLLAYCMFWDIGDIKDEVGIPTDVIIQWLVSACCPPRPNCLSQKFVIQEL